MASTATHARRPRSSRRRAAPERPAPPANPRRPDRTSVWAQLWPQTVTGRRALLGILLAALALRVYNLMGMFPVLVDESIYMRWAEIIQHQGQWLISLLDGKPPLTYWLLALPRFVWEGDPLLQARILSVLAGLCSTVGMFAVTRRLAPPDAPSETAGLLAAGLYACFPWAILYDRLAYTEAYVNLIGIAVAWTSLLCFEKAGRSWRRELSPGLALGLGLFTKQTALLFGLVPAAAAFFLARRQSRNRILRLAIIYGMAALFLVVNWALTPEAPTLESHDAVLHHKGFFADPASLLSDPFLAARKNVPTMLSYIGTYVTWPLAVSIAAGAIWLARLGSFAPWLLLAGSLLPVTAEAFLLELMFPTRYPFPYMWPWLAVAAVAAAELWKRLPRPAPAPQLRRGLVAAIVGLLLGPYLFRSGLMLAAPRKGLHPSDVHGFMSDVAHVGWGVRKAVELLKREAQRGPFVLLTDPIWGPPADAMFPYLNQRYGIRVYEAWWMQNSGEYPILPSPNATAEVIKSHYERVSGGQVDFSRVPRVFYITDTFYYSNGAVHVRQPSAHLVASFPKPVGRQAINVYRLK